MTRPQSYGRKGGTIFKRPNGPIYLAQDVKPILDAIDDERLEHQRVKEAGESHEADVIRLEAEVEELKANNMLLVKNVKSLEKHNLALNHQRDALTSIKVIAVEALTGKAK